MKYKIEYSYFDEEKQEEFLQTIEIEADSRAHAIDKFFQESAAPEDCTFYFVED